ncbi:MAG TPA: hypothetical protein VFO35_03995, partial [Steroidobacteraceae bacterium]|nr:hypothetical protein [Steroidobacteraceae bacterium]
SASGRVMAPTILPEIGQEFSPNRGWAAYKVTDIAAVHRELKGKGVRFEDEPHVIAKLPTHDLWMTFARDSEDNIFALMEEVTSR